MYKQLKFQRIPATFSYALRIPPTQLPIWKLQIPGGRVQINFENQDRYEEHKRNREISLKLEGEQSISSILPPFTPQSVIKAECLPFVATVYSIFEAGWRTMSLYGIIPGPPPLRKVQRNASPMASPGIKAKLAPQDLPAALLVPSCTGAGSAVRE